MKIRKLLAVALAAALVMTLAPPAVWAAEDDVMTVNVTVKDDKGVPIGASKVEYHFGNISTGDVGPTNNIFADSNGKCVIQAEITGASATVTPTPWGETHIDILMGNSQSETAVCRIGATEYSAFADALSAVQNGGTITLLRDINSAGIQITGKSFTLDLDGYNLNIANTGGGGLWLSSSSVTVAGPGSVVMDITGNGMGIYAENNSGFEATNGAAISITASTGIYCYTSSVHFKGDIHGEGYGVWATDGGEVTVDGTITGFAYYIMVGTTAKTIDDYTEDEIDGAAYRKYTDGDNTVWVAEAPPEAAPTIAGPAGLTLTEGYSATATEDYTITGTGTVTVTLTNTPDVGNITWNSTARTLDIAPGLTAGSYQVTLTASNGVPPDATLAFTLTVEAPADTTPPEWSYGHPYAFEVGPTQFSIRTRAEEDGTGYFIVVPDGSDEPSSQEVKDGTGASGSAALSSGTFSFGADMSVDQTVSGLVPEIPYDVYVVLEDYNDNLQTSPAHIDVTTGATPAPVAPNITTTSLPGGTVGTSYSRTLEAVGDTPITWSIDSGSLPTGLSLSGDTISGTPTTAGTVNFTVKATNASGNATQVLGIVISAAPITDYAITASADSGGSISPSGAVNVTSGGSQTFTITPDSGYRIISVTVDGVNQGAITTYTFTNVSTSHTINAAFTRTGGGTHSTTATPDYKADVDAGNGSDTTLPVTVDKNSGSAVVDVGAGSDLMSGGKTTVVTVPSVPDVDTYTLGVPVLELSTPDEQGTLTFNTDAGSMTVPSNMLTGVEGISGSKAEIAIGQGNKDNLPDDVKAAIGDKPLIELTLSIDGKQTDWSNPNAPVTVSIPYIPTADELANPDSIVIWYIDGSGKAVPVPNGRYNPATGTVTFFTTHFSDYAVVYVQKTFSDLNGVEWARKAIEAMASKGITNGTSDSAAFSPSANITRADYMILLINTLGLTAEFTGNLDDVKPGAYYYNAVGAAKKLGIAAGSGNNLFNPTESISRQDMIVLTARALEKYQGLEAADNSTVLEKFSDKKDIAEYAVNSLATLVDAGLIEGSGNKLTPRSYTTRAEVAVFLYNIYNKYPNAPVIMASTLSRLSGQSRIDTALSVAKTAYPNKVTNAVLATANNYPDALAGSVLAFKLDAPILLVGSSEADQAKILDYLKANLEPEGTVYILGGTGVIDQSFADKLSTGGITNISRIAGNDRYDTSVKIAEQLNVKTGTPIILVSGENYPDALAVSSVAAQKGWPVLLTAKGSLSDEVKAKISALRPEKIYIIGLEGAISSAVENKAAKLAGLAKDNIIRIGGADRYATSLAIAEFFNLGSRTICIATGNNFPDALSGSVYAAKTKAPIILTGSTLPVQIADYVESRKPAEMTIFGGEAVVGRDVEQKIKELAEI